MMTRTPKTIRATPRQRAAVLSPPPPAPTAVARRGGVIEVALSRELHTTVALSRQHKFLYPKELSAALEVYGFRRLGDRACCRLVRELRASGLPVIGRTQARAIDALAWLLEHPDWHPYPRHLRPNSKERGLALAPMPAQLATTT